MSTIRKPWNPAEFHYWYEQQNPQVKAKAWADLSSTEEKRYREWHLFENFYRAIGLDVAPSSVSVCEPPMPDVCCSLEGRVQYFELGEVVMQKVARDASMAQRTGASHGGAVSTSGPLLELFRKKCLKLYRTNGTPLHLLLYFNVGHQYPMGAATLASVLLPGEFEDSQFTSVFVYNDWDKQELDRLVRSEST